MTSDHPAPDMPSRSADEVVAPTNDHKILSGKKFCEAGEGWCRVCEKMSDVPVLRSEELLQGRREVLILHGNEVYRLLCTKNNKLILQK